MARKTPHSSRRRSVALVAVLAASAGAIGLSALAPSATLASSHREAPLISQDPLVDNTDTYAFVDPKDSTKVDLIANWQPFEFPSGGPNFYKWATDAQYNINVDNDGDGFADHIYTWTFADKRTPKGTFLYANGPVTSLNDPNLLFQQTYSITESTGVGRSSKTVLKNAISAPSNVGGATMPDYAKLRNTAVASYGGNKKSYAGQADDSFFLDLRVFDLLYGGKVSSKTGNLAESGTDSLAGFNVQTIALQVPIKDLVKSGNATDNPVIGVWSTTNRRNFTIAGGKKTNVGPQVQVSRLGAPLVNEVVAPYEAKDLFNSSRPGNDSQFAGAVLNSHVAVLLNAIFGLKAPTTNRTDLVAAFATGFDGINSFMVNKEHVAKPAIAEELRLNTALPYTLSKKRGDINTNGASPFGAITANADGTLNIPGDTGFPNGRRLTDDVVDIELQAINGALAKGYKYQPVLSDRVGKNDVPFSTSFPYVALPHSGGDPVNVSK